MIGQKLAHASAMLSSGQRDRAEQIYREILLLQPYEPAAALGLGLLLAQRGRIGDALDLFEQTLAHHPRDINLIVNLAILLQSANEPGRALARYDEVLEIRTDIPEVYFNRGVTLRTLERFAESLESFDQAVNLQAGFAPAWNSRGIVLQALGRPAEAVDSFSRAVTINPTYVQAWFNGGIAQLASNRPAEALIFFEKAATLQPQNHQIRCGHATALRQLGRYSEALAELDFVLTIEPNNLEALNDKALVLSLLGHEVLALQSCQRAIALRPGFAMAHNNLGVIQRNAGRLKEALDSLNECVRLDPDVAAAWDNRGTVLRDLGLVDEAMGSFDRALALDGARVDTLLHRAELAWGAGKNYEAAIADMLKAQAIDSQCEYLAGDLIHLRMQAGDWRDFEKSATALRAGVRAGQKVARPFMFQAISQVPSELKLCSQIYAVDKFPTRVNKKTPLRNKKLHIGYLAGEFRDHPTGYLMAGVFELHDREAFRIFALDNSLDDKSDLRARLLAGFDEMIPVTRIDAEEAAKKIREAGIDILVNLNGFFGRSRMDICSLRPAELQVNYLGFPATLGAPYIDYLIADRFVIPENEDDFYTEKIVWLPGSYQANDSRRRIAPAKPSRSACGLPDRGFVFCNFNQSYKLTPDMFSVWLRILNRVEHSLIWLLDDNPVFKWNLWEAAERGGIARERIVFAPRLPVDDHLARLSHADLLLDTLPYNAHTTGADALWSGVPILTCRGAAFAGRVGESLLNAVALAELVTATLDEYENCAVALAGAPERVARLREHLICQRDNLALFDTPRFVCGLEDAFRVMQEKQMRGDEPSSFHVPAR
jgi:predicted O-linked N-acetylglucosamine transferase (SPINDLY family)